MDFEGEACEGVDYLGDVGETIHMVVVDVGDRCGCGVEL